jgi:hypothetical protein
VEKKVLILQAAAAFILLAALSLPGVAEPIFSKRCTLDLEAKRDDAQNLSADDICPLQRWSSLEFFDARVAHTAASQTAVSMATNVPLLKADQDATMSLKAGSFNGESAIGLTGLYVVDRNDASFDQTALFAGVGASLNQSDIRGKLGFRVNW